MSAVRKIYQASPIKRKRKTERRTKARIEQLGSQIIEALSEDHPQSVRHVFYLMTNPRLPEPVEKSDRGYCHVQDRLVKLRRAGRVPYGWISDTSRHGYFVNTYSGVDDFLGRMKGFYRADLWQQSDYYCEVWSESRSIASVILTDCRELAVSLYPSGGFTSLPFAEEAAMEIKDFSDGRPVVIFYVGDYDPAGVLIDVKIEQEMRRHLPKDIDLEFRRVAITEEQIHQYDLPTKPRKLGEKRALHIEHTVEAEAMPAHILRELLRNEIELLLPSRALEIARIEEAEARKSLDLFGQYLKKSGKKK